MATDLPVKDESESNVGFRSVNNVLGISETVRLESVCFYLEPTTSGNPRAYFRIILELKDGYQSSAWDFFRKREAELENLKNLLKRARETLEKDSVQIDGDDVESFSLLTELRMLEL